MRRWGGIGGEREWSWVLIDCVDVLVPVTVQCPENALSISP